MSAASARRTSPMRSSSASASGGREQLREIGADLDRDRVDADESERKLRTAHRVRLRRSRASTRLALATPAWRCAGVRDARTRRARGR